MKPLSRRRFCLSAALGSLFCACPAAFAQTLDANADLPAQTLHTIGVRMLREGRTFVVAAQRFRAAIQKEPNSPDHYLGLGCALASRSVSVSYAAAFFQMLAGERAAYPKALQKWEQGRAEFDKQKAENPESYAHLNYDDTKPKIPPARDFVTKDDNVPFGLTPAQTVLLVRELSAQAQEAWQKGVDLSHAPVEKAQALYVQGWGLWVLQNYLAGFGEEGHVGLGFNGATEETTADTPPDKPLSGSPTLASALKALEQAVALAPDNATYHQAVGDLLWDTDQSKALAAYEKAADLAPKNSNLLYFLYQNTIGKASEKFNTEQGAAKSKAPDTTPSDPFAVPLGYLRRAAARDRANAWPLYEEAAHWFRLAPYSIVGPSGNRDATPKEKQAALDAVMNNTARNNGKRAIDLIMSGNHSPRYNPPLYEDSVPVLLAQAWNFNTGARLARRSNFSGWARLRELARSVVGYAQVMGLHENNATEAVRAGRANIGMGLRIVEGWPTDDDEKSGKTVIGGLVGAAICAIGYKGLMQTYEAIGDKEGLAVATKENEAFQARVAEYKKLLTAKINETVYNLY